MDRSPPGSSLHGDSPGKNTGVGCQFLLQGIFPTQELNPGLPHRRLILYHLSHQGSPQNLFIWPVGSSLRYVGSLLLRVGSFVTAHGLSSWHTQAQQLWCEGGLSCPMAWGILFSPPGTEPVAPALQGRFLTTGPSGKSQTFFFLILLKFLQNDGLWTARFLSFQRDASGPYFYGSLIILIRSFSECEPVHGMCQVGYVRLYCDNNASQ